MVPEKNAIPTIFGRTHWYILMDDTRIDIVTDS
jgi:hypothetical protein